MTLQRRTKNSTAKPLCLKTRELLEKLKKERQIRAPSDVKKFLLH